MRKRSLIRSDAFQNIRTSKGGLLTKEHGGSGVGPDPPHGACEYTEAVMSRAVRLESQ